MKKIRIGLILALIISVFIMITNISFTNAMTVKADNTPTTVYSGQNFTIIITLSEDCMTTVGYIKYDPDLLTISTGSTSEYEISQYDDDVITWIYSPSSGNATINEIQISATATTVTEETVTTLSVENVTGMQSDGTEETASNIEYNITIKPKTDLTVSTDEISLEVGESETIEATGNGTLTWSSENESIATVDQNGKITGVSAGTTTITVTDEAGETKNITVTVTDPSGGLTVDTTEVSLEVGSSVTIEATGVGTLTWTSSDTSVATVDQNGKITAVGAGIAYITVTDEAGNKQTIKVIVTDPSTSSSSGSTSGSSSSSSTGSTSSSTYSGTIAQTGEDDSVLMAIIALLVVAIVISFKSKTLKELFDKNSNDLN